MMTATRSVAISRLDSGIDLSGVAHIDNTMPYVGIMMGENMSLMICAHSGEPGWCTVAIAVGGTCEVSISSFTLISSSMIVLF